MTEPTHIFISDLHLEHGNDGRLELLKNLLAGPARYARLFILGDLFDYWIGDDAAAVLGLRVADLLRSMPLLAAFQHGNRDFLLGDNYADLSGLKVLPEEYRWEGPGGPALLLHGDTLCTADVDYQRLRKMLRDPAWQQQFLARPLAERIAEAKRLREISREAMQVKAADITDVHPDAVEAAFRRHQVTLMIHGHTHRPGVERYLIDGQECSRWVLPAWDDKPGYLRIDPSGPRLCTLDGGAYF